jgi:hypothetical protein
MASRLKTRNDSRQRAPARAAAAIRERRLMGALRTVAGENVSYVERQTSLDPLEKAGSLV